MQPGEGVVRNDLRESAPAGAPGSVHREKAGAGHALRHERQLLPEPRIGARDGALGRCDDQLAAGIARRGHVENLHEARQQVRAQPNIGVQIDPDAMAGAGIAVIEGADLTPLRQFLDAELPAPRGKGRCMGAGAGGGVVAAAIGDDDRLDRAGMVLGQDRLQDGVDVAGLVMRRKDDGTGGHLTKGQVAEWRRCATKGGKATQGNAAHCSYRA